MSKIYRATEAPESFERTVTIYTKNPDGSKRAKGEMTAKFRSLATSKVEMMADEGWGAGEIFDEVVIEVGPVGHPTENDEDGNPKKLPPEEALESVREDFNAVNQILQAFWDYYAIDPKSRRSRRRRGRG